jgi:hypothetical protein
MKQMITAGGFSALEQSALASWYRYRLIAGREIVVEISEPTPQAERQAS